ncbi:epsin-1 [Neoarius graeffei]|uniref:epsin-1 n=1 Tax=Neoarius graeffei TaxID=443677 RepID=UPI00298D118C|nr:epsin-1 [Neoarius graeffei]
MTQSMIRRTLKNLVQNFSEAEVKVREATSNDPWGPSSSQMADISDLTYNVVACNEIMGMLWKRLNDDKNWRHVYKSLTLLEYLLKTGSDRIPKQSQENIHIIKPLIEYRFTDKDGKDQGVNVREKAKIVMLLIRDEEKRKEEREFAMKTKDKLATASLETSNKAKTEIPPYTGLPSLDNIPSVADLTASMAKKKEEKRILEEKKKEEERRAKEGNAEPDLWEQAATVAPPSTSDPWGTPSDAPKAVGPAMNDPWGTPTNDSRDSNMGSNDPWGESANEVKDTAVASNDPWGGLPDEKTSPPPKNCPWGDSAVPTEDKVPATNDPWGTSNDLVANSQPTKTDPWGAPVESAPATSDPWETPSETPLAKSDPWGGDNGTSVVSPIDPFSDGPKADNDPWDTLASSTLPMNDPWGAPATSTNASVKADPFGDGGTSDAWGAAAESDVSSSVPSEDSKNPSSFLGEGASLVDLDSLM